MASRSARWVPKATLPAGILQVSQKVAFAGPVSQRGERGPGAGMPTNLVLRRIPRGHGRRQLGWQVSRGVVMLHSPRLSQKPLPRFVLDRSGLRSLSRCENSVMCLRAVICCVVARSLPVTTCHDHSTVLEGRKQAHFVLVVLQWVGRADTGRAEVRILSSRDC